MAERHDKERHWETDKDKERRGHEGAQKERPAAPTPHAAEPEPPMAVTPAMALAEIFDWMEAQSYDHTGSIDASCCRKLIQLARAKAAAA